MDTEDAAEHMESAHEAEHHGKDPFDKRVAGTMAVIAVVLAITAMLSHSANGKTLAKQIESGSMKTDSGKSKTESSDQWAFYQAKKIRAHEDASMIALAEAMQAEGAKPAMAAQIEKWKKEMEKYEKDGDKAQEEAKAAAEKSDEQAKESEVLTKVAELQEHKASVLDLGELTVQVSLVLCSVAILAKKHAFWFAGVTVAAVGVCIGAYALTLPTAAAAEVPGSQPAAHATT